jgi:hypothetical protein
MSDEVVELYSVAEIIADGLAKVHMIGGVVRFCFWKWEQSGDGSMHKVCAGKVFITKDGLVESRPQITAALGQPNQIARSEVDLMTAH